MAPHWTDRWRELRVWVFQPDAALATRRLVGLVIVLAMTNIAMFSTKWLNQHYQLFYEKYTEGCLPYSLYAVEKNPAYHIKRGDIVMFIAHRMEPVLPDGARIGKLVIGLPGDQVKINEGQLFLNGDYWGTVALGARKFGKQLNSWDRTYVLGPDEFFVYGSEPRSWDSRFWGPVKRDEILALAHPIL